MKKYILLAVFAFVAFAAVTGQTQETIDSLQQVLIDEQARLDSISLAKQIAEIQYQDSVMAAQEAFYKEQQAKIAYKDSLLAVKNLQYVMEVLEILADSKVHLDSLQFRPILLVDAQGRYYTTVGQYAIEFSSLSGSMSNQKGDQVRLNLYRGQAPQITFSNIQTKIAVDPNTLK